MRPERWNTKRIALAGALCGAVYGGWQAASAPTDAFDGQMAGSILAAIVAGAAVFACVSGLRNAWLRAGGNESMIGRRRRWRMRWAALVGAIAGACFGTTDAAWHITRGPHIGGYLSAALSGAMTFAVLAMLASWLRNRWALRP
jgi:hypothetical protein